MNLNKIESHANLPFITYNPILIPNLSKKSILIGLICLTFILNLMFISCSEEKNFNKTETNNYNIHKLIITEDLDKEELEKRRKFKACDLLIKIRLSQDMVNH